MTLITSKLSTATRTSWLFNKLILLLRGPLTFGDLSLGLLINDLRLIICIVSFNTFFFQILRTAVTRLIEIKFLFFLFLFKFNLIARGFFTSLVDISIIISFFRRYRHTCISRYSYNFRRSLSKLDVTFLFFSIWSDWTWFRSIGHLLLLKFVQSSTTEAWNKLTLRLWVMHISFSLESHCLFNRNQLS